METVKCFSHNGRIGIPKKMRDTLGITGGEPLIIRTDGKSLVMEKYRELDTWENTCRIYLRAFSRTCGCTAIICDTDRILASTNGSSFAALPLSEAVRSHIRKGICYQYDEEKPLDLSGDGDYRVHTLCPILSRSGAVGAVILPCDPDLQKSERDCAVLLAEILSERIKNQN